MVVAVTVAKAVTKAVVDAALHAHALSVRVPPPPLLANAAAAGGGTCIPLVRGCAQSWP